MKKLTQLLFLVLMLAGQLNSQKVLNFSVVDIGFPYDISDMGYSIADFFDYDNDGDLDILITYKGVDWDIGGWVEGMHIIENQGNNNFANVDIGDYKYGSFSFGDFDNDDDTDILYTGVDSTGVKAVLILKNTDGVFEIMDIGISGNDIVSAEFGDFDNDGDLDIGMCSSVNSGIFENNLGSFQRTTAMPANVAIRKIEFCDYDNDGDLDFSAILNSSLALVIYKNDNNNYTAVSTGIAGVRTLDWGDYDNDGDLDLLAVLQSATAKVLNNNSGTFEVAAQLRSILNGSGVWVDYDNDCDNDIIISGCSGDYGSNVAILYNNNSGSFSEAGLSVNSSLDETFLSVADYNNDGKLDVFQSGKEAYTGNLRIGLYKNLTANQNFTPSIPSNLSFSSYQDEIILSWDPSSDVNYLGTHYASNLTYNITVGTEDSLCYNVKSSSSDVITGYRRIVNHGNSGHNTYYKIDSLQTGTYYWSVQAIDNIYSGSDFAPVQSFVFEYPPQAPTALEATEIEMFSFNANWSASVGATGYFIDVARDSLFTNFVTGYENIEVGNVLTKKISGLDDQTEYFYRIRSHNSNSCPSPDSDIVSLITLIDLIDLQINCTANSVALNWLIYPDAVSYQIYGSNEPYGTFELLDTVFTNSWNSTIDTSIRKFYYVVAVTGKK